MQFDGEKLTIHPRIAYSIVEQASLVDNEDLQELWAGLFASSCNDESDDGNIIFIETLKRLTGSQVKFLTYLCEKVSKSIQLERLEEHREVGFIKTNLLSLSFQEVCNVLQHQDLQMVSLEIGVLESMELVSIFRAYPKMDAVFERRNSIQVKPSAFLLQLYVRCQGFNGNPLNYFHPLMYNEFVLKTNNLFNIQESKFLDFLSEKYELQKPHAVHMLGTTSGIEDTFLIVDPTFLEVNQSESEDILIAYAICNWQTVDFERSYQVKVRTKQNKSVMDTEIGSFSVQLGFKNL